MVNLIIGFFILINIGLVLDFLFDIFKMSSIGDDISGI